MFFFQSERSPRTSAALVEHTRNVSRKKVTDEVWQVRRDTSHLPDVDSRTRLISHDGPEVNKRDPVLRLSQSRKATKEEEPKGAPRTVELVEE